MFVQILYIIVSVSVIIVKIVVKFTVKIKFTAFLSFLQMRWELWCSTLAHTLLELVTQEKTVPR